MNSLMNNIVVEFNSLNTKYLTMYEIWINIKKTMLEFKTKTTEYHRRNITTNNSDTYSRDSRYFFDSNGVYFENGAGSSNNKGTKNHLKMLALKLNLLLFCNAHKKMFDIYFDEFIKNHTEFLNGQDVDIYNIENYLKFIDSIEQEDFKNRYIIYLFEQILKIELHIKNTYSSILQKNSGSKFLSIDDEFANSLLCLTPPNWWIDNIHEYILDEKKKFLEFLE